MKKLLLFVLMGLSMTTFAQLQSNKTAAKLGYQGAVDLGNGDKKFSLNFNSTFATLPYGSLANDGKGLFCVVLSSEAPVGKVTPINNKKADNWGSNCNVYKMKDIQSMLDFSVDTTKKIYNSAQQFWKPTNCIVNVPTLTNDTDRVLAVYPGMYKKVNLGFQVSIDGGGLKSDVSFELMTADRGTTGKAAKYKMIVSVGTQVLFGYSPLATTLTMDTAATANVESYRALLGNNNLWIIDDVYTTTLDTTFVREKINIAEKLGVTPGFFNGKKVYVTLYSPGTGSNIEPGTYDPVIAIDNVEGVYAAAAWAVPTGVATNSIVDHNNGSPVLDTNGTTDYSAGTPVSVIANTDTPIKIYLTSLNRAAVLDITEANDGGAHNPKYSFAPTGAVKAKDALGNYTIDVPYTYTPSDGTTKFDLKIAAPENYGIVNDTLEISINVNVAEGVTSAERLEITNGQRFWYDVSAIGTAPNGVPQMGANAVRVSAQNNNIYTFNATSDVRVTNLAGQTIKIVSAETAKKGISVLQGAYIVKTGDFVQKVVVQ